MTQTTEDARALAARLRADIGVTSPRRKVPGGAFAAIARLVGYGDMDWPHGVTTAMYGISDASRSGRLSGAVKDRLGELTDWQWCGLVADVATSCGVSGEVPRYLIERFAR